MVGRCTSSIWIAANFSSTERGVRPGARSRSRRRKRDVQAVGQEGDEDVGFDPVLQLVVDRPQGQVALEVLEGLLDLDQLDVELPQLRGDRPPVRLVRSR